MRRTAATLVVFSIVLLPLTSSVGSAQGVPGMEICNGKDDNGDGVADEGINCDHYVSYLLDQSIQPISVVLRDQFIDPTDFTLDLIERLLNPARKIHEGIMFTPRRRDLHYLAYRLRTSAPFTPRTVLIENQFERREVVVTKPRSLLTPTGKRKMRIPIDKVLSVIPSAAKLPVKIVPPVPKDANHFLCYDIEPYDIAEDVFLKDQFQGRAFEVVRALYLCNPAEKRHDGQVYNIADERNHLMCYEVIPHNPVHPPVLTHDQFGLRSLTSVRTEELCLPTVKTHLTNACLRPDTQGTAIVFDTASDYRSDSSLVIVPPTLASEGLTADAHLMSGPDTIVQRIGTPETGETYTFQTEILQLTLSGGGRVLDVPVNGQIMTQPRTPGDPVQSFDADMHQLQGQLPPGDPDFDLLRVTAGAGLGLPSPGHTTLVQQPDGNWHVDSFFDITYRIDFVGAPGGPLAGQSGSHVGTVRLQNLCTQTEAITR